MLTRKLLTTSAVALMLTGPAFAESHMAADTEAEAGVAAETGTMSAETETDTGVATDDSSMMADSETGTDVEALDPIENVMSASLSAEALTGERVYDANNDWIGEVDKVLLSDGGDVQAVIIDVGGFLGIGEKPVSVDYSDLKFKQADAIEAEEDMSEETDGDMDLTDTDINDEALMNGEIVVYVSYTEDELNSMDSYEEM